MYTLQSISNLFWYTLKCSRTSTTDKGFHPWTFCLKLLVFGFQPSALCLLFQCSAFSLQLTATCHQHSLSGFFIDFFIILRWTNTQNYVLDRLWSSFRTLISQLIFMQIVLCCHLKSVSEVLIYRWNCTNHLLKIHLNQAP